AKPQFSQRPRKRGAPSSWCLRLCRDGSLTHPGREQLGSFFLPSNTIGYKRIGGAMSINGPADLAGMRAAGAIVRRMLEAMKRAVRPGISTAELDAVGATVMR